MPPQLLAGLRIQAIETRFVAEAVELHQTAFRDRRRAVAGAKLLVPNQLQPALAPPCDDSLLRRTTVLNWAEKNGPVAAGGARTCLHASWRRLAGCGCGAAAAAGQQQNHHAEPQS